MERRSVGALGAPTKGLPDGAYQLLGIIMSVRSERKSARCRVTGNITISGHEASIDVSVTESWYGEGTAWAQRTLDALKQKVLVVDWLGNEPPLWKPSARAYLAIHTWEGPSGCIFDADFRADIEIDVSHVKEEDMAPLFNLAVLERVAPLY